MPPTTSPPAPATGDADRALDRAADLAARWARARRAALQSVLGAEYDDRIAEPFLAAAAGERDQDAALRTVYDNSRRLGASFARFTGCAPGITDVVDLLAQAQVPCLRETFQLGAPSGDAFGEGYARLERPGCAAPRRTVCDHYREATDGLVIGMSGGAVRFARHRSVDAGDEACVDVLYASTGDDDPHPLRLGPIPDEVRAELEHARRALARMDSRARIDFLGLSEGHLYYVLETVPDGGGAGALALPAMLERAVARRLPGLRLVDATPRAVLGPGDR